MILLKADQVGLITGITEVKEENKITISPNPNQGDFRVNLLDDDHEIMIFDLTGRLTLNQRISPLDGESLKISNLKQGNYLIRIKSDRAYRKTKVLVF